MSPRFPGKLTLSASLIFVLLLLDSPGYLKFASINKLANLFPKTEVNKKEISQIKFQLCAENKSELDKKLKQIGFRQCKTK